MPKVLARRPAESPAGFSCSAEELRELARFVIDAAKYPDEDAVMGVALDAGAADFQKEVDVYEITCDPPGEPLEVRRDRQEGHDRRP